MCAGFATVGRNGFDDDGFGPSFRGSQSFSAELVGCQMPCPCEARAACLRPIQRLLSSWRRLRERLCKRSSELFVWPVYRVTCVEVLKLESASDGAAKAAAGQSQDLRRAHCSAQRCRL